MHKLGLYCILLENDLVVRKPSNPLSSLQGPIEELKDSGRDARGQDYLPTGTAGVKAFITNPRKF